MLARDPKNAAAQLLRQASLNRVAPSETNPSPQNDPALIATAVPTSVSQVVFATPPAKKGATIVPLSTENTTVPGGGESGTPLWPLTVPLGLGLAGYGVLKSRSAWSEHEAVDPGPAQTPEEIARNRKIVKVAGLVIAAVSATAAAAYVLPRIPLPVAVMTVKTVADRFGQSAHRVATSRYGALLPKSNSTAIGMQKLPWGSWASYTKIAHQGRQYAQIGNRLYTEHAVERMLPGGLSTHGRSISPTFVEEVIRSGSKINVVTPEGIIRTIHRSGHIEIITEQSELIIITVKRVGS